MGKLFKEGAKGKEKTLGGPIYIYLFIYLFIYLNNNDKFYKILVFIVILNPINDWEIMKENVMNETVVAFLKGSHNLVLTGMHLFLEVKCSSVRLFLR